MEWIRINRFCIASSSGLWSTSNSIKEPTLAHYTVYTKLVAAPTCFGVCGLHIQAVPILLNTWYDCEHWLTVRYEIVVF